jgi:hypothetical protein
MYGITHPFPTWLLPVMKRTACRKGWHAFDEVKNSDFRHYLHCDACGLEVDLMHIPDNLFGIRSSGYESLEQYKP